MEFNNIRNFVEKFSVPDQDMEAPPDLNGVAKIYAQCVYCKCYHALTQLGAYKCNACLKENSRLIIYYPFQCLKCNAIILHQDGSLILCSQCDCIVGAPLQKVDRNSINY